MVVPVPAPLDLGILNPGRVPGTTGKNLGLSGRAGNDGMLLPQGIFVVAEVGEVVYVAGGVVVVVGHGMVVGVSGLGMAVVVVASDVGGNLWLISSLE